MIPTTIDRDALFVARINSYCSAGMLVNHTGHQLKPSEARRVLDELATKGYMRTEAVGKTTRYIATDAGRAYFNQHYADYYKLGEWAE